MIKQTQTHLENIKLALETYNLLCAHQAFLKTHIGSTSTGYVERGYDSIEKIIEEELQYLAYDIEAHKVITENNREVLLENLASKTFTKNIETLNDPLLSAIFSDVKGWNIGTMESDSEVMIEFKPDYHHFKDFLVETEKFWLPFVQELAQRPITTCSYRFR